MNIEMRYLRVFEIARSGEGDAELSVLAIDLPTAWAESHEHAEVSLSHNEHLGWGAKLVGGRNEHLVGFAYYDHVDQMFLDPEDPRLPPDVSSGAWDDLEQCWWASIRIEGADVYIAETDLDALLDVSNPGDIVLLRPGVVSVGGVEVLWNRVPQAAYDAAWQRAVARFMAARG
jgi:hypothetical protein